MTRRQHFRRGMALASLVALASGLWACSLLVKRGETQCAADGDCTALFGGGSRCTAEKVCSTTTGNDGAAASCTTNKECIDGAGGQAAICRKDTKTCVKVTSPDCAKVFTINGEGKVITDAAAVENDDTVLIGSLTALQGSNQLKGEARVNAVELALSEFVARGGVTVGTKSRPVAVLSCNDIDANPSDGGGDPAVVRSSRHLVSEVGVAAIVGGGNSGTTTSALKEITAKGSLLIAPSATATGLTANPDKNGLFFRTAPSDVLQAIPLVSLIKDVEGTGANKKLVLLSKGDAYGQGLRDQIVETLTFNGTKLSDPANNAFYTPLEYSTSSTFDFSTQVSQVIQKAPNIVVVLGTNEAVDKLVKPIDAGWTTGPRPTFIVSDGLKAESLQNAIRDDDAASPTSPLRTRVRGTAPGRRNSITDSFAIRYNSRFSSATGGSSTFGTAGAYDAAYLILHALGTIGDAQVTGASVAAGIRKISKKGGQQVEVGPNGIDTARPLLKSGADVDLNGASSPLDFDAAGESIADIEVWCALKAVSGLPQFLTTAKYYNSASTPPAMVGTFDAVCTTP